MGRVTHRRGRLPVSEIVTVEASESSRRTGQLRALGLEVLAQVTRHFHPRGTDRLLRLLHNPDRRTWWIEGVRRMDGDLALQVSTRSFQEWRIFFYGFYEEATSWLIHAFVPPGGVAVDVG